MNFQLQYEIEKAKRLFQAKKYDQADDKFKELAADAPNAAERAQLRTWAARALGRRENRYEDAVALAESIKESPYSIYARMDIMSHNGKYKTLLDSFKDVDIAAWPEDIAAQGFYLRAYAYRQHDPDSRAGIRDLEQCIKRFSPDARKWIHSAAWLGDSYTEIGDYDKALETCRDTLTVLDKGARWKGSSYHARMVQRMVEILEKLNKYEEAIRLVKEQKEKINDKRLRDSIWWRRALLVKAGDVYAERNQPEKAITAYRKAIAYNKQYIADPEHENKNMKQKMTYDNRRLTEKIENIRKAMDNGDTE